jgi:uncharacterized protein (DUF58 family)
MAESLFSEEFLQRLERLALAAKHALPGQTQGERRSPKRGQSVEFADFRPYVAGDDFRRIDWNAYARLERFFIKLFVEEEDLTVHFLVDTSRSMDWGQPNKLDYARRVAGALGYIALAGLDRVTVTALGGSGRNGSGRRDTAVVFPPQRGKRQALGLFTFLQALAPAPNGLPPDPAQQLRAYTASHTQPGLVVLLSDLLHDGWLDGLRALASARHEISVIHILSPEERDPQLTGDLKLIDNEDNAEVEITADYDLLARYRQNLDEWQAGLRAFCRSRNISYVPVETTLDLDELLFAWLQRQGVLR